MTICIVAKSYIDNCIVAVSDRRISFGDVVDAPDNAALKAFFVSPSWGAVFSASNIGPIPSIRDAVRRIIKAHDGELTASAVRDAFREAWWESANQRIADLYLAPMGMKSVDEFRKNGLAELGTELFTNISAKILRFDPGVSFLVYGFCSDAGTVGGHIFEVQTPNPAQNTDLISDHDITGYGIIGSGSWPALASLAPRGASVFDDAVQTVYRCCEAKFCAESAGGVGRATTVMVFRPGLTENTAYRVKQFPEGEIDKFREIWSQERKQPIPAEAARLINSRLYLGKFMTDDED